MTFDRRLKIGAVLKQAFPEYPAFFGFDYVPELKACIEAKTPFIYGDHAYFERGYEGGNFRIIKSDIHQLTAKKVDVPRMAVPMRDWRKGSHILVFPPSVTIAKTFESFGSYGWVEKTISEIRKHTDRKIIVKLKQSREPLAHFLNDCHAVVGYGTVASVEAALLGVPVFSGPRCPATPVGLTDLSKIEDPIYPDRNRWVASLTYSQFHLDEIKSGYCREILNGLG